MRISQKNNVDYQVYKMKCRNTHYDWKKKSTSKSATSLHLVSTRKILLFFIRLFLPTSSLHTSTSPTVTQYFRDLVVLDTISAARQYACSEDIRVPEAYLALGMDACYCLLEYFDMPYIPLLFCQLL